MRWNPFLRTSKLKPLPEEIAALTQTKVRFRANDLYGRLESQSGEYIHKPLPEDKKSAADLMKHLKKGETRRLIGVLRPLNGGVGLYFRGLKIDTLTDTSAKSAKEKVSSETPVIFDLTHVTSRDGERSWPSIKIRQGRSL
jgi:hypothetical protein